MSSNVWVEKYRPTEFENIVLDEVNKKILQNIIDSLHFPNLLLYGPPGTGKTTTIINLITHLNTNGFLLNINAFDFARRFGYTFSKGGKGILFWLHLL